jgi:hypothetical protein
MNKSLAAALAALPLAALSSLPVQAATPPPSRPQPPVRPPLSVIPRPKPSQPIAAQQAGNLSFYTKPQTGVAVFQTRLNTTAAPLLSTTTDLAPKPAPVIRPASIPRITRPTLTRPTTDLR